MLLFAVAGGAIAAALLAFVRPELPGRLPHLLVPLAAIASAVVVALADTAPTGWEPLDLVLRAGFGAIVPLAASKAGTLANGWLVVVSVVVLVIVGAPLPGIAGAAAGAYLALAAAGVTTPPVAAIAAAAALGPMAHAEWELATGASAAAVAVATVPVLLGGLARAPSTVKRVTWAGVGLVVLIGVVGAVGGGLAALDAKDDVDAAVELATTGIDQLGDDDERARENLREAAAHFGDAEDTFSAWWAKPALLVPGVAQQARAVSTMASAGADLARTAADASEDADVDSVRPRDGQVDLDALTALEEPLGRSLRALRSASTRLDDVDSPLLLTPVADRLVDLSTEVEGALGSAEVASQAIDVAPEMLGADGPRRYFVAIQNPAELRGNGGFMGNWAEITTDGGRMELTRSGRVRELSDGGDNPNTRTIDDEPEFVARYGQDPARAWGLIAFSPDHPTVSRVIAELYPESGGQPLDGVFAVTPAALGAFLELTGPVTVPGYPQELTAENAERIMLHEQYLEFPQDEKEDREGFLADAVQEVFDALTEGALPAPSVLTEELGPAVEARDLQLWSTHPEEQALFERIGATGSATRGDVDSFGVVTQNFNGNKIDWFLRRSIRYEAIWDPEERSVEGTITARIENGAPAAGLPPAIIGWGGDVSVGQTPVEDGENLMMVTLYSTHPFETVAVDGKTQEFSGGSELGHHAARFYLSVPPGGVREVVADVGGELSSDLGYVVRPIRQPTAEPDTMEIELSVTDGWTIEDITGGTRGSDSSAMVETTAAERIRLGARAVPAGRDGLVDRLRGYG